MIDLQDVKNIEGGAESENDYFISLQRAINSGDAWSLQGSYGRSMMSVIEDGHCLLGRNECRDYWGNRIPSRDQVKAGTKGSLEYVADRFGQEWADKLAAIE